MSKSEELKFLRDMFPDGNIPDVISEASYQELKKQHKATLKERNVTEARSQELANIEYRERQLVKNSIDYSEELAQEICERISGGELMVNLCNENHMPTARRCNQWLKNNEDFQALYNLAIQDRLTIFEEQIIQIADDAANDLKEVTSRNSVKKVVDSDVIARAKLRVEVRFRHLKAGRPQKWGDTSTLITKSAEDDPANMPIEELERRIAELDAKETIIKSVT